MEICVKEEPVSKDEDQKYSQFENSLSLEDSSNDHESVNNNETLNAFVAFPAIDLTRGRILNSKLEQGTKRRLRFSEADDMLLLRRVAALNPYKCSALWKEVTHTVAQRADKNFSVRSVREHTDLLMNTFSLRGAEVCLKRTPPELWDRKKQLLEAVYCLWKRDVYPTRSPAPDGTANKKMRMSFSEESQEKHCSKVVKSDTSKNNSEHFAKSSTPTLQQPKVPVTLHFRTAQSPTETLTCAPLLGRLVHPVLPEISLSNQVVSSEFSTSKDIQSTSTQSMSQSIFHSLNPSKDTPDLISGTEANDWPIALTTSHRSASSNWVSQITVNRSTSPIPLLEDIGIEKNSVATQCDSSDEQNSSLNTSVDSSTSIINTEEYNVEQKCKNVINGRWKISTMMRNRLNFIQKRQKDHFFLKKKELDLENRRLVLEERKLTLEERKLCMEEEKWKFEKRERERKLLLMLEEGEHKMVLEKGQQNRTLTLC